MKPKLILLLCLACAGLLPSCKTAPAPIAPEILAGHAAYLKTISAP